MLGRFSSGASGVLFAARRLPELQPNLTLFPVLLSGKD
jgi:hypothetical protein